MESVKSYTTTIKLSLVSGFTWLVLATALGLLNQIQLMTQMPGPDYSLGFGILRPVFTTALLFGAGLSFFLGSAFYIVQKQEGVVLKAELAGLAALLLVNFGVLLGVLTIFLGFNKGREFGEMTFLSDNLIAIGLVVFLIVLLLSLNGNKSPGVSTAFILAAAAGGLVVYALGNIGQPYGPLVSVPFGSGVGDLAVQEFYRTGLLGFLILLPAFAAANYFIPAKFDVALNSQSAARFQLVALTVLGALAGMGGLVYSPAPELQQTFGVIFALAFAFATIIGGVNLFQTMRKSASPPRMDGERRFLRWGLYLLMALAWFRVITAFRWGQEIFAYTYFSGADLSQDVQLYAAMIALGATFIIARDLNAQKEASTASNRTQGFYLAGVLFILIGDMGQAVFQSAALRALTPEGGPAQTVWTAVLYAGTAFQVDTPDLMYLVSLRGLVLVGNILLLIGLLLGAPKLGVQLLKALDFKSLLPKMPAPAKAAPTGAASGRSDFMLVEEDRRS